MFNGDLYMQIDGVAMGSPLGPILANIFMVELENKIIPRLNKYLQHWYRYVDDTFAVVDPSKLKLILNKLNSFDRNIKFTHEVEQSGKINFLDVNVQRTKDDLIETSVYRKKTNTDLYIHWDAFAPMQWKKSTLIMLIKRAFIICSTDELREQELEHIKHVFCNINGYPKVFVNRMIEQELSNNNNLTQLQTTTTDNETDDVKNVHLSLPYAGKHGEKLINKMRKNLDSALPITVKPIITFNSNKLGSNFNIKDQTKFEHNNNLVYMCTCPYKNCNASYIGETKKRINERIIDHNKRDKKSHVLKHSRKEKHRHVWVQDFTILSKNYKSNIKRKISEALFIKSNKPCLNVQEKSFPLKLFN